MKLMIAKSKKVNQRKLNTHSLKIQLIGSCLIIWLLIEIWLVINIIIRSQYQK